MLHIAIEDSRIRMMFRVVSNLTGPTLLGTSIVDKWSKGIFLTDPKIVLFKSPSVSILVVLEAARVKTPNDSQMLLSALTHYKSKNPTQRACHAW